MLDLFCGRFGWGREFAARGWDVVGFDKVKPAEIPKGCEFVQCDVLQLAAKRGKLGVKAEIFGFLESWPGDFICASSPCEEFSKWGMRCFHPDPPYPALGVELFNHTRRICEDAGVPYVMENVRAAQQFVGAAAHHCGPFYLWGTGVPTLMHQGIIKGARLGGGKIKANTPIEERRLIRAAIPRESKREMPDAAFTAKIATIPPELANCVADYAERLLAFGETSHDFTDGGPGPGVNTLGRRLVEEKIGDTQ